MNKDLPYVLDGETYPRTDTLEGDVMTCKHVTEHKTGKMYLTWKLDYTDVTREQLIDLATRSVKIALRPQFKKVPTEQVSSWVARTFSVLEYLEREKSTASPMEKAERNIALLSDAEKAALLKKLKD